jgi:hypothetical protein
VETWLGPHAWLNHIPEAISYLRTFPEESGERSRAQIAKYPRSLWLRHLAPLGLPRPPACFPAQIPPASPATSERYGAPGFTHGDFKQTL